MLFTMARNETTSMVIDDIIRFGAMAATVGAMMLAPNILIALEKPLDKLFSHLDTKDKQLAKERELKRVIRYMKDRGYLAGEYEHGLQLTEKARKRLICRQTEHMSAKPVARWDKTWRIIVYDIPNTRAAARQAICRKLRQYGCFHLQRSVLITPFPCFEDVTCMAAQCDVEKYVTYFETGFLANDRVLIKRFAKKYPETAFS